MNLEEVNFRNLYKNWRRNLKETRVFVRSTPFVSLQTYDNFDLNEYHLYNSRKDGIIEKALNIILDRCSEETFVIVDLNLNDILDLAFILNNEYQICPILNLNLLFHPFGIVGNRRDIKKLVYYGMNLDKIHSPKNVMLIPYNRYDDDIDMSKMGDKLNNQYGVTEEDFPDSESLKMMGYKNIVVLTYGKLKEDINEYLKYISKEIHVEKINIEN